MVSLAEARAQILGRADPVEPIEVPLTEALGLVLAEPVAGDVDLPPFDRAAFDGYALRAADARPGDRLRVVGLARAGASPRRDDPVEVGPEEALRVTAGDPMPPGADAVLRTEDSRPESGVGPPRLLEVLKPVEAGRNVVPRGYYLRAGTVLATAGTRLQPPLIGLLAAEGVVAPLCHRRVRVAVLAVGDHLVNPGEAPVMHRERNATGSAVVAPCLRQGATAHDLGVVADAALDGALARALSASVVVVVGDTSGATLKALARAGVETVFSGLSVHPGKRLTYGVAPGGHHVFLLPPSPIGALTVVTLLIGPLIARLQGGPAAPPPPRLAAWEGAHRPTDDRLWAVPITLSADDLGRPRATPIDYRGKDDLLGFSRAEAIALLPPRSGPWRGGELVEVVTWD